MIAVGLALDGMLARDDGAERAAFGEIAARIAGEVKRPLDAAAVDDAFARMHAEVRAGRLPVESGARRALRELFADDEIGDRDRGLEYRLLAARTAARTTVALPGARELLARLAELSMPCAILANGWYGLERQKAQAIGFSGPVLVPPVKEWKPAANAFAALVRLFGLPTERVWYVGPDPRTDVAGARAAGLQAVWFAPADRRETFPDDVPAPDHVIHRLDDLLEVLRGPYARAALSLRRLLFSQY